jgi:flagellar motility protein MotE (MotC chaperone)
LPATIVALAALLAWKSGLAMLTAFTHLPRPAPAMVPTAVAAGTEAAHQPPAHPPPKPEAPKPEPPKPEEPRAGDSERALLQELRERRKELDSRAETVAARETLVTAMEQKIASRIGELKTLQVQLEAMDSARHQSEDAGWQGLVKLYEAMKPKDAAGILNDMPVPVLLELIGRMKDAKAAAVMAAMNPDKARDVTAAIAKARTGQKTTTGS